MLFSQFITNRLETLEHASRGFGNQITERSLYSGLPKQFQEPVEFAQLIDWGLTTGLLQELDAGIGRRFSLNRRQISFWRRRANGERPTAGYTSQGSNTRHS